MTKDSPEAYPFLFDDGLTSIALATDAATPSSALRLESGRPVRVNPRFVKNILSHVEGHNAALLRKEREEKLGLRKHPLADKIREIERQKLEEGRRRRRRSQSPTRLSRSDRGHVKQEHMSNRGKFKMRAEGTVQVRGRGSQQSNVLDAVPMESPLSMNPHPVEHLSSIDTDVLREHRSRQVELQTTYSRIEEDGNGKWKCGAGYM